MHLETELYRTRASRCMCAYICVHVGCLCVCVYMCTYLYGVHGVCVYFYYTHKLYHRLICHMHVSSCTYSTVAVYAQLETKKMHT